MAKVTLAHVRQLNLCTTGIRAFCRRHGVVVADLRSGVDSEILRATGDPFAVAVAELAEREQVHGRKQEADSRV